MNAIGARVGEPEGSRLEVRRAAARHVALVRVARAIALLLTVAGVARAQLGDREAMCT